MRRTRALAARTLIWLIALVFCALPALAQDATVLTYGSPESVGMDHSLLDQAAQLFRDAVDRDELRGAVLMVGRRGTIVMHEAIGWRHKAYRLPMERDTLFRMASNTKPVVATAALILAEDGRLSLDDNVATFLESFDNWRSRRITVFHLLTHSSGFRIGPIFYPFDEDSPEPPTLRSAVDRFGKEGPEVEPGTSYSYSNAGYNSLGAVIEARAAMPLEQFLKTRIYDPLGMVDTLNHEDPTKLSRMATVYRGRASEDGDVEFTQRFTPGDPPDYPVIRASGGMISTAMDYAKFLQMYLNGGRYGDVKILSEDSVQNATKPHLKSREQTWYGLGWSVTAEGVYSHGGSDGTMAWVDPSRDLFGIVFTQSPGGKNPRREFQRLVAQASDATSSASGDPTSRN